MKGDVITEHQFFEEVKNNATAQQVLLNMTIQKVFEKQYGSEVSDKEVDDAVAEEQKKYGDSYQTILARSGMTAESRKAQIRTSKLVEYAVKKYAGYMPVTSELLADSDANITAVLTKWLAEEDIAIKNAQILTAIGTKAETDLKNLDGIKKAVNVTLGAAYAGGVAIVTNDDGLNYLDTLVDKQGRYLLSPDFQNPMQMVLAVGARKIPVKVVPNTILATKTNKIPFIVGDLKEAVEISQELKEELGAEGVSYDANIAKISAIGIGLKTHYETTAEIFDTLAENGINIDMISCSEINVSCIIKESDVEKAVRALHSKFLEN